MTDQYPVVAERVLSPVPPKRLFSRGAGGRAPEEVPVPLTGHRLVYRVRGDYVLDTAGLALDSPTVVDASHVSVVDVTTNTVVAVELTVPSRDGSYFTMLVTFRCTVADPVEVVRAGAHSAEAQLSGYLRAHQRIFELGLEFDLDAINDVRRKLSAQVAAYVTLSPPGIAGMVAELASVEVSTPEEVIRFREALREEQLKHVVRTEQLTNEQRLGDLEDIHKRMREVQDSDHVRALDGAQRDHARSELRRTAEAVASDPLAALALAYSAGELTAKEFADELKLLREQEIAQDREDLRARIEYDREQTKLRWEAERDDRRRELEARQREIEENRKFDHERARERWEAERVDRVRSAEREREDRQLEREASVREIEAKLEVVRELAKHGHLDTLNLRLDRFVHDMLAGTGTPAIEAGADPDKPAITATEEPTQPPDDSPDYTDEDDQSTKVEA